MMKKIVLTFLSLLHMTTPAQANEKIELIAKEYEKGDQYEPDYIYATYRIKAPLNVIVMYGYDVDLEEYNLSLKLLEDDVRGHQYLSSKRYLVEDEQQKFIKQLKLKNLTVDFPCRFEAKAIVNIAEISTTYNINTTDNFGIITLNSINLLEPLTQQCSN